MAGGWRACDTYALLLFATTGTILLAGARDLLVLVVAFLLASIPLYGLIGLARTPRGAEATMKAYLMGALFGILLLLGVTLLYGVTGSTLHADLAQRLSAAPPAAVAAGLLAVVVGLMFEAGGVPAHFWVPDAPQGANATAAPSLTPVPKTRHGTPATRLPAALRGAALCGRPAKRSGSGVRVADCLRSSGHRFSAAVRQLDPPAAW